MPRRSYYEIPRDAYLLQEHEESEAVRPEELVRQWCAYELIRAYGYIITDITFEHPVKVGSKNYRIDIFIQRDGKPFIIIECKKQGYKQHESGMEQAISYANAQRIKADYAVYTNGEAWHVKRCINGRWAPVNDIPKEKDNPMEYSVDLLYRDLNNAAPLLHKLIEPLNPKETHRYLEAMQRFFYGSNLLTQSGNKNLRYSLDNLLRCLLHIESVDGYLRGKFLTSFSCLKVYANEVGLRWNYLPPMDDEHPFWQTAPYQMDLLEFLEDTRCEAVGIDYHLLEVLAALFGYCHEFRRGKLKKYPSLPSDIQDAMRNLLNYGFKRELQHRVPVRSDKLTHQDIEHACSYGWDSKRFSLS